VKLYASDEHVEVLGNKRNARANAVATDLQVELAWHLRQRDTNRALDLTTEAELLLSRNCGTAAFRSGLRARLGLVRAEAAWLGARLESAETELEAATAHFQASNDLVGQGDALLLEYHLADDRGETGRRRDCLRRAEALYAAAHDPERKLISLAWQALDESFGGATEPLERAQRAVEIGGLGEPSAVRGLLSFARAQLSFLDGDYGAARLTFEQAARELRGCGLVRQAISAIVNAGAATGNLNDFESQTEIVENALALGRVTGWPQSMGTCLYALGDAHHSLGRVADARSAFVEARDRLQPLSSSRAYVAVTTFLAEVNVRLGLCDEALEAFEAARIAAERGGHSVLLQRILVGLAGCLSRLGRASEALQTAHQALQASEGRDLVTERLALLSLARIHGAHALAPPDGATAPSASLHYLNRIWSIQESNQQWMPDDEILGEFAAAWERVDDLRKALTYERRRIEALARESTCRAEQQVVATQARHEALMARVEADHERGLAESERRRQIVLAQLSMIGQEITASLDAVDVLSTVDRHVGVMLDVAALSLWLLEDGVLRPAFFQEDGKPVQGRVIPLDHPQSSAAKAARENREILVEYVADEVIRNQIPGTRELLTALFAPLTLGTRVLGVISIQSAAPHAYGDHERLIFRNICAYSAIALANASHYQLLSVSHKELVAAQEELERLANFDALTGLCNRRLLDRTAKAEIGGATRSGLPLYVLMIDIDHFKRVNDSYGHSAGDTALKTLGMLLVENLRPRDTVARYGGEEIVALLPETEEKTALAIAERLRQTVASQNIEHGGIHFGLTVSIGVSRWHASEPTIDAAFARADEALYLVKNCGRNAVMFSGDGNS
jgi:diguanylate cyclase (GGDEF)-like protein